MGKGKRKHINPVSVKKGARFEAHQPPDTNEMPPVFSLERVQRGKHCFSELDQLNKAQFAESIFRRKSFSWKEIQRQDRHGLGTEKIAKHAIHAPIPSFITEDETHFLAFRYNGKRPMVGYRRGNVFYVLWFDPNFELYDH